MTLAGCPLEERISEFHKLRAEGWPLGALAMICIDNPMVAATGHRICNDCMKSCIYQKQDPVDIPQSETRMLKDVLALPWGFEIYSLLTRWNPLNLRRPVPLPRTGKRVLVVGMGPAGFTLAHHLINDGHTVVAIDGLKIEPLDPALSGITIAGERVPFAPVRDTATLIEPLDDRVMAGFGGVAEYGITVRWDKNFLKMIRLLLERRDRFALYGGVRFGGTLDDDGRVRAGLRPRRAGHGRGQADGARPAERPGQRRAHGVRLPDGAAADRRGEERFDRQHAGAPAGRRGRRRPDRDRHGDRVAGVLPGAGREVPRALRGAGRRDSGAAAVEAAWTPRRARDRRRIPRARARDPRGARRGRSARAAPPRIAELLQRWGGVTIAYRRRLIDSPSYTLNHEEIEKALEEGIRFAEGLTPLAIEVDARRRAPRGLKVSMQHNDGDGVWHESGARVAARAHDPDRRRHAAQHGAGARGRRAFPSRRQVFPAARRGRASPPRSSAASPSPRIRPC